MICHRVEGLTDIYRHAGDGLSVCPCGKLVHLRVADDLDLRGRSPIGTVGWREFGPEPFTLAAGSGWMWRA